MELKIIRDNIANVKADAIVLPANEKLKEGTGASKAIFERAGRSLLKKACGEIGFCEIGTAVPTPAFELDAKYIIHAVVPKWKDGEHDEYGLLSSAYLSALKLAEVMGCESIAFPLLAAGNNGFDRALAFKIATESIALFDETQLKKALLIAYDINAECFIRSQGYEVVTIETKDASAPKKKFSNEAKKTIEDGMKKAVEWLKDKNHQKQILEIGLNVAIFVLSQSKGGKGKKTVDLVRKIKSLIK